MSNEEEYLLEPDKTLQKEIGVPLTEVFTEHRISAAKKVVAASSDLLLEESIAKAKEMKLTYADALSKGTVNTEFLNSLKKMALGIKAMSGQAGYEAASGIAKCLFDYLDKNDELNSKSQKIVQTMIDSIYAVFYEGKGKLNDAVAQEILKQLKILTK